MDTQKSTNPDPSPDLLHPENHSLVFIDMQSQMAFATKNIAVTDLRNNAGIVAGATKIFNVPTVITTVNSDSFTGPVFPELAEVYSQDKVDYVERTTMNAWEDTKANMAITGKGRDKIVFAGLWTSVCIATAALSAKHAGYEVYFITDACGDISAEAHEMAIDRMLAAGISPITSILYLLELQRDWARQATYQPVVDLIKRYGGAYGIGLQYASKMLPHK